MPCSVNLLAMQTLLSSAILRLLGLSRMTKYEMPAQVFEAAEVPIVWEEHYVDTKVDPRTGSFVTMESMDSVRRNRIGLKGPMATPIGKGHKSLNLTLRKELGLFANVRPCLSIPGFKTRYDNVDLVTIRENTEGEYSGLEHTVCAVRQARQGHWLAQYWGTGDFNGNMWVCQLVLVSLLGLHIYARVGSQIFCE